MSYKFVLNITYMELTALILYLIQAILLVYVVNWSGDGSEDDLDNDIAAISRAIFLGMFQVLASYVLFKFAVKYKHTSREIPMMYQGELSHLEISRRYRCFTAIYIIFLVLFNAAYAYYNYYFLKCQVRYLSGADCLQSDKDSPVAQVVFRILMEAWNNILPTIVLYSSLHQMAFS